MNEDDKKDFEDSLTHIILDYVKENPLSLNKYDYIENLFNYSLEIFQYMFEDESEFYTLFYNKIDSLLDEINFTRSYNDTYLLCEHITDNLREKIEGVFKIEQPEQRTLAWYLFRYNHITASNACKCMGSESQQNSIIYEKCKPFDEEKKMKSSFADNSLTWGHKYEPVTNELYEDMFKTKVSDCGCIPHSKYKFLAASPDGLVTGDNNYGRLVEYKNPISRKISGIPKEEYYIQMQLQMEVCDIDECDFLETKFVEYENFIDFSNDISNNDTILTTSREYKRKGCILLFSNNDEPHYEYMPLQLKFEDEINNWINNTIENSKYNWIKNIYWKLDEYSCILVKRNKLWFSNAIICIENTWNIIEKERGTYDYLKRAPKKRTGKKSEVIKLNSGMIDELLVVL